MRYRLENDVRDEVLGALGKSTWDRDAVGFLNAVTGHLATVRALKRQLAETLGNELLGERVAELKRQTLAFRKALEATDPDLTPFLALHLQTPTPIGANGLSECAFVEGLRRDVEALHQRLEIVDSFRPRGGGRGGGYFWYPLIEDILIAYRTHFGEYPPVEENGPAEKALRVLLATEVEPPDELHLIARSALMRLRRRERRAADAEETQ